MKHIFAILAMVVAVGLAGLLASGTVAAQDAQNTTENISPTYEERIDSSVVLVSYSWSESAERFELELRNEEERPQTVTITESVQRNEGAGQMSIRQERLLPGETTLSISVQPQAGEAAVTISSSESIDRGQATYVSTGVYSPGPWTQTTSGAGWAGGITVMAGMTIAAGLKKMRNTHNEPQEV